MKKMVDKQKVVSRTLEINPIKKISNSTLQLTRWRFDGKEWKNLDGGYGNEPFFIKAGQRKKYMGKIYNDVTKKWEVLPEPEPAVELEKGDFFILRIKESAGYHKDADDGLIERFEKAINSGQINWKAFEGSTHHIVNDPAGGKGFKAHFDNGNIKLYIDQSKGKKSKYRVLYKLEGMQLKYIDEENH